MKAKSLIMLCFQNLSYLQNLYKPMSSKRRIMGIITISALTLIASTGFRWQFTKYLKSKERWRTINNELRSDTPSDISLTTQQFYPFKYVKLQGLLSNQYALVKRGKDSRLGWLIFRKIKTQNQEIAVLDGWIPEDISVPPINEKAISHRGLLKTGQKKDYLNRRLNKDQKEQGSQFKTYINLNRILQELNIQKTQLNTSYFVDLFKNNEIKGQNIYPIRYTKNDFQMPYLTPERHMNYAMFWGGATLVGIWGVFKALKK